MQQQQDDLFKVAPIISDQKQQLFNRQILQTITGVSSQISQTVITIVWAILLPLVTFILPLVVENKIVAIVVPTGFNVLGTVIVELISKRSEVRMGGLLHRILMLGVYSFLWANHVYVLSQFHRADVFMFVFSALSIVTSILTVGVEPVKEFAGNGVEYSHLGWDSTLYMRLFIAFPTLLSEFIIYNSNTVDPNSATLFPLRTVTSLVCLIWWVGWVSSIKNTLQLLLNKIGMVVFGNQSQFYLKDAALGLIFNLIPIAIYYGVYEKRDNISISSLIVGSSLTSVVTVFRFNCFFSKIGKQGLTRPIILIVIEFAIAIALSLLYNRASLSGVNLTVFLAIDVGLYFLCNLIKQMTKGWSRLGFNFQLTCISYQSVALVERILLRAVSGFCVLLMMVNYLPQAMALFPYDDRLITYIFTPFLGYRSFKRCISETSSFSLHISLLLCLIAVNSGWQASGCLLVLMMPPFPSNAFLTLASIFSIPPKAKHKNECLYQLGYLIVTIIGLALHYLSLGILQFTMVFGLPLYFPTIATETEGYSVKSAENSLYEKIIQNINPSIFRMYEVGFYLLRIEKYILLMEVKSSCFGFCQILDFRGLEVQEVTSCHSKEGQTIDRLVEQTWGDNKKCFNLGPHTLALSPFLKESVHVPTENDIQLTGVIEAKEFVTLFKDAAIKSIVREYSLLMLTDNQKRQAEGMMGELSAFYKKDGAQSVFPFEFAKQFNINASYPVQTNKIKLPPINKKNTKKVDVVHSDFLDLLENSEPMEHTLTTFNEKEKQKEGSDSRRESKLDELNMAAILSLYYYSVGKLDYVNTEKLFKIIKRESEAITQIDFDGFDKLLSIALGTAFKISIDRYINGQFEITVQDFEEYDKNGFLGTSDSEEFKEAILQDKEDIWTVSYAKRSLAIKRMARSQTNMYIFKVNETILKSVWNNLRFELIYATNDNDERYSIQTHPTLLRNLWVQACEQPFGYPSFHSGPLLNQ